MKNKLQYLFLHCSATTVAHNTMPVHIRAWHKIRFNSGNQIGYRSFIDNTGFVHRLIAVNNNDIVEPNEVTFGASGFNSIAHHICYAGGLSAETYLDKNGNKQHKIEDTRNEAQKIAMEKIVRYYIEVMNPNILVIGHNQAARKGCPSFFVPDWLEQIGIPERNIDRRDPFGMKSFLSKNSQFVKL